MNKALGICRQRMMSEQLNNHAASGKMEAPKPPHMAVRPSQYVNRTHAARRGRPARKGPMTRARSGGLSRCLAKSLLGLAAGQGLDAAP